MSRNTDEHQSSHIKVEDEQIPIETETLDDDGDNLDDDDLDETKPIKKSILPIKTVSTIAVLAALIGGISIAVKQFKPASSMAGMEDMKGMSMEDMMKVDGAANATPVKVESIKSGVMEGSIRYTATVRPYQEVMVNPRVGGQLTDYSVYPGSKVKAGQVLARLNATELSSEVAEAVTAMAAAQADERASRKELGEQQREVARIAAEGGYLATRLQRTERVSASLNAGGIQGLAGRNATELSSEIEEAIATMEAAKADEQASRKEVGEQQQEIARISAEGTYLAAKLERTERVLLNSGAIALNEVDKQRSELAASKASLGGAKVKLERMQAQITKAQSQVRMAQAKIQRLQATSRNEFDKQRSELMAGKASLGGAEIKLERMQAQIAKAQSQVQMAQAKIQRLKAIEGYKIITSPITGIVQERMADPGVVVQAGMGILKIGDYSKVRLQANVAQQNLTGIQIGSPIVARVMGNANNNSQGRVTSIFPKAGEETRTVTVEAIIDNSGGQFLGGQAVEMQIITAHKPAVLSVLQAATIESEGKQAVWILAGKSAQRKFITTGLTSGDRIEVTSGLKAGDLVIISGQEKLIENSLVVATDDSGKAVASLSNTVAEGNTQIKLISPQGKASAGDNQLILEVQDAKTKQPVKVEGLDVSVTMPMKNAAPMSTDVEIKPDAQPGRFKVSAYLGMNGKWEVTAKVKDKSRNGSGSFTLNNSP